MARIDHLVVRAATLAAGVAHVEAALGVAVGPGGVHRGLGTHNRLLSLGAGLYLEVIAPNPDEPAPQGGRMFDMDNFEGDPALSAWVLRVNSESDRALAPAGIGPWRGLSRGDLRWQMTFPPGGRLPFGGAFPALIRWQGAPPALADSGCRLLELEITHPQAPDLARALAPLLHDSRLRLSRAPAPRLVAHVMTPAGPRRLA